MTEHAFVCRSSTCISKSPVYPGSDLPAVEAGLNQLPSESLFSTFRFRLSLALHPRARPPNESAGVEAISQFFRVLRSSTTSAVLPSARINSSSSRSAWALRTSTAPAVIMPWSAINQRGYCQQLGQRGQLVAP